MSLSVRDLQPEWLDRDDVPAADRQAAYDGLDRMQWLSRTGRRLLAAALPLVASRSQPLRWVDLGCGSGRILLDVARLAHERGLTIDPVGVDFSGESLAIARQQADREGIAVEWIEADVLADDFVERAGEADVVSCSLFLHHFTGEQIVRILQQARSLASVLVVDDLRRTRLSYALAWVVGRAMTRSRIVHHDGSLSVRAALTTDELGVLAREAGLLHVVLRQQWPQRVLLSSHMPTAAVEHSSSVRQPPVLRDAS